MHYREQPPPPALARHIAALWSFRLAPGDAEVPQHAVPPDGGALLAVALASGQVRHVALVGPTLSALRVPVQRGVLYLGLRATPVGATLFLPGPANRWRDRRGVMDTEDPARAAALRAALAGCDEEGQALSRLAEQAAQWLANAPPLDTAVEAMVARIVHAHGRLAVQALAAEVNLGYRQALRRFEAAVGLQPKELARLRRLRHACLLALARGAPGAADIAAGAGFADQPHMSREFMEFFGWPPGLTLAYLRRIEHLGVA
ncbi:helix-turn-helix domain-containing protein [Ramlibacter sp.]|uniref:helix-turn-helix domain-containing protein n=1 Tax=Ramlibacter sp. TaxID=1917967 RepID=UPI0035B03B31